VLNYFQNKGFSGRISADLVNTIAVIAGLGLVFENNSPVSYTLWWVAGYIAAVLTLLTATYLRVRFAEAGESGIDVLFWVTLFVAICTFLAGFLSLLARILVAQQAFLSWIPLLVLLTLLIVGAYLLLSYYVVNESRKVLGPLIGFFFLTGVLGITMATLGGLSGPVRVPFDHGLKAAATIIAVLGLIFWQDAELLNLFSNPAWIQKLKSGAQCVGALLLLIAVILTTANGVPYGWFWSGTGIAILGTVIGIIDGIREQLRKWSAARQSAVAAVLGQ